MIKDAAVLCEKRSPNLKSAFIQGETFKVLGTQKLTDLRDHISCVKDDAIAGDFSSYPTVPNESLTPAKVGLWEGGSVCGSCDQWGLWFLWLVDLWFLCSDLAGHWWWYTVYINCGMLSYCFFLSVFVVCLCLFLTIFLSLSLSFSLSLHLFLSPSLSLSPSPPFSLSLSLCLSLSPLSLSLFLSRSVSLTFSLSLSLSLSLSPSLFLPSLSLLLFLFSYLSPSPSSLPLATNQLQSSQYTRMFSRYPLPVIEVMEMMCKHVKHQRWFN